MSDAFHGAGHILVTKIVFILMEPAVQVSIGLTAINSIPLKLALSYF